MAASLFQSLVAAFRVEREKVPGGASDGSAAATAPAVPPAPPDFEEKLHRALSLHGPEASSRVYLIELERLRDQFGEKWNRMEAKIHAIAHESIERHLAFVDVYAQYGASSYVIVFAQLNRHEAQLKCLLIAKEMARRLIGTEAASNEITVMIARADEANRLVFEEIADFETTAQDFRKVPASRLGRDLLVTPQLSTEGAVDWESVQFIYRPLLTLRGMVVSTYICLPIRRTRTGGYDSGYEVLQDQTDPQQIADLDLLGLATVATEAERMAKARTPALLSLPVHFETLANHQNRPRYLGHCRDFLDPHAGRLVFELVNLPEGVPQSRLVELVGMLRPSARAVIARFPLTRRSFTACRAAGLHAVGADIYYSRERESVLMREMDQFVEAAEKEMLHTYIHGLRTISLNTAAIATGFDYIDGYALTSVANIPGQATRYDLRDLYRPLLGGIDSAAD